MTLLDLPLPPDGQAIGGFWAVAWAEPWPGPVTLFAGLEIDDTQERAQITAPAWTGVLAAPLAAGFEGRWDEGTRLLIALSAGSLASATLSEVLNGANRLAVETADGWEVLAFAKAELDQDGRWTLRQLLRGLAGTPARGAASGARVVVLDGVGAALPVKAHEQGALLTVRAVPPGKALNDIAVRQVEALYQSVEHRALAPVHLGARWDGGDLVLDWIRRARREADAWGYGDVALDEPREAYELVLMDDGALVRSLEVTAPRYTLSEVDRLMLFPNGLSQARFSVAQISDAVGVGRAAVSDLTPVH